MTMPTFVLVVTRKGKTDPGTPTRAHSTCMIQPLEKKLENAENASTSNLLEAQGADIAS